jgi:hypothetical protein
VADVVHVSIHGVAEMKAAFRRLPKEASKSLRDQTGRLSVDLAQRIRSSAAGSSRQSAAVARTVRARRDRVPVVVAGGNQTVTRQRRVSSGQGPTRAYHLLFGANFGASFLKQFRRHRGAGQDDYWFFSTIEDNTDRIDDAWGRVLDDVASEWGRAG